MPDYSAIGAVFPLKVYPIVGVNTGTEELVIDGDQTDRILVNDVLTVVDSTGNDGVYTVSATSYAAGPDETTITVNEDITDATVDGTILHDSIADTAPITESHDDAADRDSAEPDQYAGAHMRRVANEVRAVEKTVNVALGLEIIDAGGLDVYHSGGILNTAAGTPEDFAPGKLTLPDNDDSYVEVAAIAGVTSNITGFTAGKTPLAIVTTAAGDITRIQDKRAALGGGGAGGVPPPSVDNRLVRTDGINGEIQQAVGVILDDDDNIYNLVSLSMGADGVPLAGNDIYIRESNLQVDVSTGRHRSIYLNERITDAGTSTSDDQDFTSMQLQGEMWSAGEFLDEMYGLNITANVIDGTVQDIYGFKVQIGTVDFGTSPVIEDQFYVADIRAALSKGVVNAEIYGIRNRLAMENAAVVNDIMVALENRIDVTGGCTVASDVYGARFRGSLDSVPSGVAYMLYLDAGSNWDYAIYQNDSYPNYLGGALEVIGITTMTGGRSNGAPTELTLDAAGAITVTKGYHRVDTFGDAATDDLVTINGGVDGEMLILRAENDARSVVVKDGGNLALAGDFTLDNTEDTISLIYDDTLSKWLETGRSDNGA